MRHQYRHNTINNHQKNWGRNRNTVAFASTVKLGPIMHTVLVALMITVLGLIYLTQATKAYGYDYEARDIDTKIQEISAKKTDLEVENARLTALKSIENSDVAKAMVSPKDVQSIR